MGKRVLESEATGGEELLIQKGVSSLRSADIPAHGSLLCKS